MKSIEAMNKESAALVRDTTEHEQRARALADKTKKMEEIKMKKVVIDEMHAALLDKLMKKLGKGESFTVQRGILMFAENILDGEEVDKIINQYYPDDAAHEAAAAKI
jgi:hypothetical protein